MGIGTRSINTVPKHVRSNYLHYVDLAPRLGAGETVSSITSVTPVDSALTAGTPSVLTVETTDVRTERDADGNETTVTYVIAANKGCSFTLSGGTPNAGVSVVTVEFVASTGKTDAVACLIDVQGIAAS